MSLVLGLDVSKYQGEINWELVAAAGYRFAVIRATRGDDYVDPCFDINWNCARAAGLLVSAYHAVFPARPADSQIAHFFSVLGDRRAHLPLALDIERSDNLPPADITACVQACLQKVEQLDGRQPIIYTARWFWNKHVLPWPEWANYDLWVASYTDAPLLPAGWDSWKFWQYSETGGAPGICAAVDLDWFAGSYTELLAYADLALQPPQPSLGQWARVIAPVNVRTGPGAEYDDIGDLDTGAVVRILDLDGQDAWVVFEPGKYALFATTGKRYMIPQPVPYPAPGLRARVTAPVNIRAGPGTGYNDIGDLDPGATLDILALDGKDVWGQFEPGKWAVFIFQGKRYMEFV